MEWFKPVSIENLDPKIRAKMDRRDEQNKYRKMLKAAMARLEVNERLGVPFMEFVSLYASTDTLRVWVSTLNKKYPERQYSTAYDDSSGNTWVCRLK